MQLTVDRLVPNRAPSSTPARCPIKYVIGTYFRILEDGPRVGLEVCSRGGVFVAEESLVKGVNTVGEPGIQGVNAGAEGGDIGVHLLAERGHVLEDGGDRTPEG